MKIRERNKIINVISWILYGIIFLFLWIFIPCIFSLMGFKPWFFSRVSSKLALKCFGIRIKIKLNKSRSKGGKVFIANHSSWFDQIILCAISDCPLRFLANEKYFRTPILSVAMRLYDHIPVRFKDGASGLTPDQRQEIISYLKSGGAIVAFPESTRSLDGSLLPFRRGIFKIAAEAESHIIPVQIYGASKIFPRKAPLLRIKSGEISVTLGDEIPINQKHWEETSRKIEENFRINFQNQTNQSLGGAALV